MNVSRADFGNEYRLLNPYERHTHVHPNPGLTTDISTVTHVHDLVSRQPIHVADPLGSQDPLVLRRRVGGGINGFTYSRPRTLAPEADAARMQTIQAFVSKNYDDQCKPCTLLSTRIARGMQTTAPVPMDESIA